VLRAPFDGEIAERVADPGSFARPGTSILSVVDRSTVRVSLDVPETDYALVEPGREVELRLLATGASLRAKISRRSPAADASLRTVHVEVDVADPARAIPVGTTADLLIDVGEPIPAAELPLAAASVRGDKAVVFTVEGGIAKRVSVPVVGESKGSLFVDPSLVGKAIVVEGRSLLSDGDRVDAHAEAPRDVPPSASAAVSAPTPPAAASAARIEAKP
jgi:RND family efflux transporter MFP subunit